jgi:hypothetical protein
LNNPALALMFNDTYREIVAYWADVYARMGAA